MTFCRMGGGEELTCSMNSSKTHWERQSFWLGRPCDNMLVGCVCVWYRPVAALMFIQLSHEHPPFWWANSIVVIVCVYQKSVEMHMKRSEMNYLDTLKGSDRERYSRKLRCLHGKSETNKENSCQELDPYYYTMTTTLFAHQNGGRLRVNWINVRTATGL